MAAARKIEYRWPLLDIRLVAELIDVEKLREQVAAAEKEGRVDINNRNMQRWQNIKAAANLDRWLKAIFPAGG